MSRDINELFQLCYKLIATKKRSNYTNVNIFFKKQTFSESFYRIITLCLTWQRFKILVLLGFFFFSRWFVRPQHVLISVAVFSWFKLRNYEFKFAPVSSLLMIGMSRCIHFDRHFKIQKPLGNSLLSTSAGAEI